MNRSDFQQLSQIRIEEAQLLFDNKKYDGAYYLAGYAVEFAIKACISKNVNQFDYFPKPETIKEIYKHKAKILMPYANLETAFRSKLNNPTFDRFWQVVSTWDEQSRYAKHTQQEAKELLEAITDPNEGILTWLKTRW